MVVGGSDGENVLGDVWLLDVDKGTWTEVSTLCLPQSYSCTIATLSTDIGSYSVVTLLLVLSAMRL